MLRNLFIFIGLLCVGLSARDIDGADAKEQSVASFYKLSLSDEHASIITEIITRMAGENYWQLFKKKGYMDRLGDQIEYKVHPLRFVGHVFSDPQLKQCMVTVRRDRLKWRGFLGGKKDRGFVKNMRREMKRDNVYPHLYGFARHLDIDYDRILEYVEREDYEGFVKFLIKH